MMHLGRQGRLYVVAESAFGTTPSIASADAVRHLNLGFNFDPKNREHSPEKKLGAGRYVRFDRRETAEWSPEALIRPSGTLNTLPEASEIFEAAFGSKTNVTLATTVSSGGTTTGATLASVAGLVAGTTAVLITCPDGKKRIRIIATLPGGSAVTWTPALPTGQQPANSAAVKACITYNLTTALALSLSLAHYLLKTDQSAGLQRVLSGAAIDKVSFALDANGEPRFTVSGPAKTMGTAGSAPGAFTTVGNNPPNGTVGEFGVGTANTVFKGLKLGIDLTNNVKLRNESYGYSSAEEVFRVGRRDVTVALDVRAEDQTVLYDLGIAGTNAQVCAQTGFTEGNIVALFCPNVEWKVPDTDDPDEEVNWPFKGTAFENSLDGNDEVKLVFG